MGLWDFVSFGLRNKSWKTPHPKNMRLGFCSFGLGAKSWKIWSSYHLPPIKHVGSVYWGTKVGKPDPHHNMRLLHFVSFGLGNKSWKTCSTPPPPTIWYWDFVSFGLRYKSWKIWPPSKKIWDFGMLSVLDSKTKVRKPPSLTLPKKVWDFGILSVLDWGTKFGKPDPPHNPPGSWKNVQCAQNAQIRLLRHLSLDPGGGLQQSLHPSTWEFPAVQLMVQSGGHSGSPTFPGIQTSSIGLAWPQAYRVNHTK